MPIHCFANSLFCRGDDGTLPNEEGSFNAYTIQFAENTAEDGNKDHLVELQKQWISLKRALWMSEMLLEKSEMLYEQCELISFVPLFVGCMAAAILYEVSSFTFYYGSLIAFDILDEKYELETLGPNHAIYGYEYSKATYFNTKHHFVWNAENLKVMKANMFNQHSEMKKQLQERHQEMTNHLGNDVRQMHP